MNSGNANMIRTALTLAVIAVFAGPTQAATPIAQSQPVQADVTIDVSNVRGSIDVIAWDKNEVSASGSLGEGSKFEMSGNDSHISIRIENPDDEGSWWGNRGPKEDTILKVNVPRTASVDLDAVSADARIEGIAGARSLEAETVSGDLQVRGDAERVEVSSVSGDVELDSRSAVVSLETVSGDITARGVGGRIEAESVSGRIRLESGTLDSVNSSTVSGDIEIDATGFDGGRIKIESMSGEVSLRMPRDLSARIDVETFSGTITSDFGKVEEEDHGPGSSLNATVGSGRGEITLESFSGDVDIRQR